MITDHDIKKLQGVFATKDDLVAMENRIKKDIVDDIVQYLQNHILPLLNEHERQIDRLEKHVGGYPSVG